MTDHEFMKLSSLKVCRLEVHVHGLLIDKTFNDFKRADVGPDLLGFDHDISDCTRFD